VPNIKFNVAKLTSAFVPLVGSSVVESQIRPCLLELNSDADLDVRFFAGAFGSCSSLHLLTARRL
jgi:serine/threonine-protein phosphatase 2A regulatory subunit A